MTMNKKIEIINQDFFSNNENRKEIIDTISSDLLKTGKKFALSDEELYLTIDEAVTNAMEHGNKWDPKKKIHVDAYFESNDLHIIITDEGDGFDTNDIELNLKKRNILSPRGRGIYIMNQFCKMSWNQKGNQVDLKVKLRI